MCLSFLSRRIAFPSRMEGVSSAVTLPPRGYSVSWRPGLLWNSPALSTESQNACLPLGQSPPPQRPDIRGHPGHCRLLSIISGLCSLDANSTPPVMTTSNVPSGCHLACCVGAAWSCQPGGGCRETHHILHSYVCGLCLYPGEHSGRVWQVIRAGTMAPLTPRPQEFRLQWQ